MIDLNLGARRNSPLINRFRMTTSRPATHGRADDSFAQSHRPVGRYTARVRVHLLLLRFGQLHCLAPSVDYAVACAQDGDDCSTKLSLLLNWQPSINSDNIQSLARDPSHSAQAGYLRILKYFLPPRNAFLLVGTSWPISACFAELKNHCCRCCSYALHY